MIIVYFHHHLKSTLSKYSPVCLQKRKREKNRTFLGTKKVKMLILRSRVFLM